VNDANLAAARKWTVRYLWASTLIFFVSGMLGAMLRASLADIGRVSDTLYYSAMTVHGLGAFLGWAGFAVMGLGIWILAKLGFELRPFGLWMVKATFWLFVIGVVGIVVTTLGMSFGGSWVFLYPLPFESAGEWSDLAAGLFSASVLLVGLGIVTWCLAILHTVIGPGLHAVRARSLPNRLGLALGFGYLWPKRFATNPKPVPYAVIPLTVIAIDMIIATLPLAVLLVEMIIQAAVPSITVDPLLAKNVLWWFGHPVVYLLLFPAVAIYYYLIPKYAGRALVAGNVIAVAWTIAVIANVLVWAHHVYLDYPEHTHQGLINTLMQPMTFALVIPSALSLYSLGMTVLRSNFKWTGASTALFLGMVSWLLAGLSGIVNATIAADVIVHNTMWVVGHFHHMALLNIGLVIFGAIYHFIPELTGKRLWSDDLAKWHIWLTFLAGTVNSAYWMIDGLRGSPRRFAVSFDEYALLNQMAVVMVAVLILAQVLFVINMVQTLRGKAGLEAETPTLAAEMPRRTPRVGPSVNVGLGMATALTAVLVSGLLVVMRGGQDTANAASPADAGAQIFATSGCQGCHTLAKAGASGTVGPNLDQLKPTADLVKNIVTNGRGAMPPFAAQLTPEQIDQLATYVATSAGP
jgi:cytochrome c oxidase subunit I